VFGTHHVLTKNNKEYTSGTHDVLVETPQNPILQGSLHLYIKQQKCRAAFSQVNLTQKLITKFIKYIRI